MKWVLAKNLDIVIALSNHLFISKLACRICFTAIFRCDTESWNYKLWLVDWFVVFYVPSTARSFRHSTPFTVCFNPAFYTVLI